jgi:hypothetical protein
MVKEDLVNCEQTDFPFLFHHSSFIIERKRMINLVDTFSDFKSSKNIDRPTMVRVLEDVFRTLLNRVTLSFGGSAKSCQMAR